MNVNTVRQQLNIYLAQGKINFIQLQEVIKSIDQYKLMKDLTSQERDFIINKVNGK